MATSTYLFASGLIRFVSLQSSLIWRHSSAFVTHLAALLCRHRPSGTPLLSSPIRRCFSAVFTHLELFCCHCLSCGALYCNRLSDGAPLLSSPIWRSTTVIAHLAALLSCHHLSGAPLLAVVTHLQTPIKLFCMF